MKYETKWVLVDYYYEDVKKIYGPFDTQSDAYEFGEEILHDKPWMLFALEKPVCDENGNWDISTHTIDGFNVDDAAGG
jgi:hypothetical protein